MPSPAPTPRQLGTYLAMAQVGLEMVVPVGLGWWLDDLLGWSPILLTVGVVLGFVIGIVHLVALSKDESKPPEDKGP